MCEVNYKEVRSACDKKNYVFFTGAWSLNIVGIRVSESTNRFDDYMCVLYKDDIGREICETFPCTTKPGEHWLLNPLNKDGTLILKEGQYLKTFKIGKHNRSRPSRMYTALEQVAPMSYVRDNNMDSQHDYDGGFIRGVFKSNIHRAAKSGWSKFVDKWSAGCQVITGWNDKTNETSYDRFMDLCHVSARRYGDTFSYTLLNIKDLENVG